MASGNTTSSSTPAAAQAAPIQTQSSPLPDNSGVSMFSGANIGSMDSSFANAAIMRDQKHDYANASVAQPFATVTNQENAIPQNPSKQNDGSNSAVAAPAADGNEGAAAPPQS